MMLRCIRSQPLLRHASLAVFKRLSSSSSATENKPLLLWLAPNENSSSRSLLLPSGVPFQTQDPPIWDSVESILEAVNAHYEASHFVGGMGESDPGVWFSVVPGSSRDALEFPDIVIDSIQAVKLERHGVPFSLYTDGTSVLDSSIPLVEWDLDCLVVSLWAATPKDYRAATGREDAAKAFGNVCGLIADAAEQGVAVEVTVLHAHASAGRDLALSLGARQVHVCDP